MKNYSTLILFFVLIISQNTHSQILNKIVKKAEKKVEDQIDKKINKTVDKNDNSDKEKKDENSNEENKNDDSSKKTDAVGLQSYSKFDFIPGEKVIFYDDFSQDAIGDFPALWNTNGAGEVVTTNLLPGNWLRMLGNNAIWTDELLKLPENYTIEFDIIPIKGEEGNMAGYSFRLLQSINSKSYDSGAVPGKAGFLFYVEYFGRSGYRSYINGDEGNGLELTGHKEDKNLYQKENQKYHISIWVQKSRIRLYQDEIKIIDLPKAFPLTTVKIDRIRFEEGAALIKNIRIAVGNPDMRNKLMSEGKLISYGIYFDVNKDIVKPESYGTLKEIASILNEVPNVKVKIIGYTDSDGDDAANLDLSKRRAVAVKTELEKVFGVNGDRLITDGMGEKNPIAPNTNSANKALNRRVEFVKQ